MKISFGFFFSHFGWFRNHSESARSVPKPPDCQKNRLFSVHGPFLVFTMRFSLLYPRYSHNSLHKEKTDGGNWFSLRHIDYSHINSVWSYDNLPKTSPAQFLYRVSTKLNIFGTFRIFLSFLASWLPRRSTLTSE